MSMPCLRFLSVITSVFLTRLICYVILVSLVNTLPSMLRNRSHCVLLISDERLFAFFIQPLLLLPALIYYVMYIDKFSYYMVRLVHCDMPLVCLL